jgi:hypothetical protein
MNRKALFMPAMLFVVGVGTSLALPVAGVQTPEARDRAQAVRVSTGDVESEKDEIEAPRTAAREDEVQAPRADDVQAPRAEDVQAPRGEDEERPVEAPRGA